MAMNVGGSGRTMSEINVTPMVDIMLVLLIIFMVTAPFIQQGVDVDLPQTNAPSINVDEERLILTVRKDRKIFIGRDEILFDEFEEKLAANPKLQDEKELYLHADRALPYGFVVDIMARLKAAGVENLGMVTDPVRQERR
ncbi:MAG: ExbD/TolR family protein [Myxococcota bacterium]